jgi:CBS domain-containing protein
MPIGEICSREVVFVRRDESIVQAAQLMREHHVGDVIVVDEQDGVRTPAGILTDRDIVVEIVAKGVDPGAVSVADAMSAEVTTARESDGIYETIEHMREKAVRRLPVVNAKGALVGLVSLDDLLDLLGDEIGSLAKLVSREQKHERAHRH